MPFSRTPSHPPFHSANYASSNASSSSRLSSPAPTHRSDVFDDLFDSPLHSRSSVPPLRPIYHSLSASAGSSLKPQPRSLSASPRLPVASIISLFNSSSPSPLRLAPSREPSPSPTTTLSSRPATPPTPGCYEITLTDHWLGQQLRKPPPPVPSRASSRASSSCASGQLIDLSVPVPNPPILQPTPAPAPRRRSSTSPAPSPVSPTPRGTPSPVTASTEFRATPPPAYVIRSSNTTRSPRPAIPPRRKPPPPVPARRSSSELRISKLWKSQTRASAQKDRLPGLAVRGIWARSGLPLDVLRKIWDQVVGGNEAVTSLTYEQFERGIELIDQHRA